MINASRGSVVDTQSLYDGLKTGKIAGTCLDVFEKEPLTEIEKKSHLNGVFDEMGRMPQVVFTPHIAGYTHESLYKMSQTLAEKLASHLCNTPN